MGIYSRGFTNSTSFPGKPRTTLYTNFIDWLPVDKCFVVHRGMTNKISAESAQQAEAISNLYKDLKEDHDRIITLLNPLTGKWVKFIYSHAENHADFFEPADPNCETIKQLVIKK